MRGQSEPEGLPEKGGVRLSEYSLGTAWPHTTEDIYRVRMFEVTSRAAFIYLIVNPLFHLEKSKNVSASNDPFRLPLLNGLS